MWTFGTFAVMLVELGWTWPNVSRFRFFTFEI